jgi:hypothetical protein
MKRVLCKDGKAMIIEWEEKGTEPRTPVELRLGVTDLLDNLDTFGWDYRATKPNRGQYQIIAELSSYP